MKKITLCILLILVSITVVFGLSGIASAIPCGSGGVSGSVSCQNGVGNNDQLSPPPLTVNDQKFFGEYDWKYLNKYDVGAGYDQGTAADWNVTPDAGWPDATGSWSFASSVWDNFEDVMIVVKDGNIDGIFFCGYLLNNLIKPTSGTWAVSDPLPARQKDLSHLTLYARGDLVPTPEPTTILLTSLGLLGIRAFARKKRVKS